MKTFAPIGALAIGALGSLCAASDARAFTHVVQPGETLAQVAVRIYGDAKLENILVGANQLDAHGGTTIFPGVRLEIPAPTHHRVAKGETWYDLAQTRLGDKKRSELLAKINNAVAWIPPVEGTEILFPAVFTVIAGENATINQIWDRYFDDPTRAWELNNYNNREGLPVRRGEAILVPVPQLKLTDEGKREARQAAEDELAQGGRPAHDIQRRAESEIALLLGDVRYGRYAEAIARANQILGMGALTHPQSAAIYRSLVEAYVAFDAWNVAISACAAFKEHEPKPNFDPIAVSPKIREACAVR